MFRSQGEEKAWSMLQNMSPEEVCKNADVIYDKNAGLYTITCADHDFTVSHQKKEIISLNDGGTIFLTQLSYFFTLSLVWYFVSARDIPMTERLIRADDLKGGDIFFKGSHVLPLNAIAQKYGQHKDKFIEKSLFYGGKPLSLGDVSFELRPMPRIAVALILWLEDEEFPPRIDFLFDSSCEFQVPLDIIWSLAMMSTLIYLK